MLTDSLNKQVINRKYYISFTTKTRKINTQKTQYSRSCADPYKNNQSHLRALACTKNCNAAKKRSTPTGGLRTN